jgi:hypothetical protein
MRVITVSLIIFLLVLIFALFVGFINFGGIGYNAASYQSRVINPEDSRSDNTPSGLRVKFNSPE